MAYGRLELYKGALREISERAIVTLSDNVESRRLLDEVWGDSDGRTGGVKDCLEAGLWTFATRFAKLTYDNGYTATMGYKRRFALPEDFVRTVGVYVDASMTVPLEDYEEKSGYLYANQDDIYVDYVSNHASYGLDFTKWPQSFKLYAERYFGSRIIYKLTKSARREEDMIRKTEMAASAARTKSAMEQPSKKPARQRGTWVSARMNGSAWRE